MTQSDYFVSFKDCDIEKFKRGLAVIQIRNDNHTMHTLNDALKKMLLYGRYYNQFVFELLKHGSSACNDQQYNTLSSAIIWARQYIWINKNRGPIEHKSSKEQMFELIQTLVSHGAQGYKNDICSVAITESNDPRVIIMILHDDFDDVFNDHNRKSALCPFIKHSSRPEYGEDFPLLILKLLFDNGFKPIEQDIIDVINKKNIKVIELYTSTFKISDEKFYEFAMKWAFITGDLHIIKMIHSMGAKEYNNFKLSDTSSLTYAVSTNNLEIVDFAYSLGYLPYNTDCKRNTLSISFNKCPTIVFKIIQFGGKIISGLMSINHDKELYLSFEKYTMYPCEKNIDLMMCAGIKVCDQWYKSMKDKIILTNLESKLLVCYKLLNQTNLKLSDLDLVDINALKQKLIILMDQLIEEKPEDRENKINTIDQSLCQLPHTLIDIIYGYQHSNFLPEYIYW